MSKGVMDKATAVKDISMVWIVVSDIKQAVKFYSEVVGLTLEDLNEEYGWAEFSGYEGGARLGVAQKNDRESIQPGQNGVVTLTVKDLVKSKGALVKKGAKMVGDVIEVPGHVKLQMVVDHDGNHFQLVEMVGHSCEHC